MKSGEGERNHGGNPSPTPTNQTLVNSRLRVLGETTYLGGKFDFYMYFGCFSGDLGF